MLTQIYAVQKAINYFNIFTVLKYIYSITNCHQNNTQLRPEIHLRVQAPQVTRHEIMLNYV